MHGWLRTISILLAVGQTSLVVACGEPHELSGADFCKEVGFAIANRTMVCEGEPDLANDRYERLEEETRCNEVNAAANGRKGAICSVASLDCADVLANGDDIAWWVAASECTDWFSHRDGSPIAPLLPDGGLPPTCDDPLILCGDTCVDLNTNSDHCGACGARCPSGTTCVGRSCAFP